MTTFNETIQFCEIASFEAARAVIRHHYLHRRPPISFSFGLRNTSNLELLAVLTFGTPASRCLQQSVCPNSPSMVIELNRLWVSDFLPRNTESWFIAKALKLLPPKLVCSFADTSHGHVGFVYMATNWHYAGLTDQDRRTPRFDYVPHQLRDLFGLTPPKHSREASRSGFDKKVRRHPKHRYWKATGNRRERRILENLSGWKSLPYPTTGARAA